MSDTAAIERYEGYLRLDPNNPMLLLALGDLYHRNGKFDRALATFDACLALDEGNVAAKGRKAGVFISLHRFTEAENAFRALLTDSVNDPVLLHNLGLSLYYQKRWPEALECFASAREQGLHENRNTLFEAYSMHQMGKLDEAVSLCQAVVAASPDATLDGYLCVLEMDRGNMDLANVRARTVLQAHPANADAALVAGMWSIEQQDMDDAARHVDIVLNQEADNGRGQLAKGLIHLYRQEHRAAIAALEAAHRGMPRHLGTLVALAWAHFAAKDIPNAEAAFRRAIAVDDTFGESHGGLAVTLVFQNRREEARREAQIARRLDGQGLGAVWAQAALLALDGKREVGERLVEAALQRPLPGNGRTLISHIQEFARKQTAGAPAGLPRPAGPNKSGGPHSPGRRH